MDGEGVGDIHNVDVDGQIIRWENTIASIILVMEPNAPLAYAPVLELHHPIMSTHVGHGRRLERERETGVGRLARIRSGLTLKCFSR